MARFVRNSSTDSYRKSNVPRVSNQSISTPGEFSSNNFIWGAPFGPSPYSTEKPKTKKKKKN